MWRAGVQGAHAPSVPYSIFMWDAEQYLRFEAERARPFFDLVAAIEHPHPRLVADLGCGPGGLTATLLARWPDAVIWGIDESDEMIDHARRRAVIDRLRFQRADVSRWQAPGPVDVIVSNACFQWIPNHARLLDHLLPQMADGGWLAFQVPNNFHEPSHTAVRDVMALTKWKELLRDVVPAAVERPEWYVERLSERGLTVSTWEVIYYHVLQGDTAVSEWLRGTTLRPVLALLDGDQQARFLDELSERLAAAYPTRPIGTVFPFRRMFVVAKTPT
jgi:trans-aconitate 2-methyltransferase